MKTLIEDHGTTVTMRMVDDRAIVPRLAPMVYRPRMTREGDLYLVKDREQFELPVQRFGKHGGRFEALKAYYDPAGSSMGILASGIKGSGKSLLCEELSNWAMETHQLPVLMVDVPLPHSKLTELLQQTGPAVYYFDEFGKTYQEQRERNSLLPIFSDSSAHGVIFLVTGNAEHEFTEFMLHRPGRFRFLLRYEALPDDTVMEMLEYYKVPAALHVTMKAYARGTPLSFDVFTKVCQIARTCNVPTDLMDATEILNVPPIPSRRLTAVKARPLDPNITPEASRWINSNTFATDAEDGGHMQLALLPYITDDGFTATEELLVDENSDFLTDISTAIDRKDYILRKRVVKHNVEYTLTFTYAPKPPPSKVVDYYRQNTGRKLASHGGSNDSVFLSETQGHEPEFYPEPPHF